ncbi:PulJ/GspJ family protein [Rhodopseudomonas palustris]|uniref:Putative general secretion pathway protein J n=1 Tax=Rhodopseudomonas palustris (strain BisB18) TaxID=316056 RepID=Q212Y7_RHOPB
MSRPLARAQREDAGFTLFEALVAIALMGLILGALATVTAQWLPNWNRGLVRAQRNEQAAIVLDRLVADLSAAEYVSASRLRNVPLFRGAEFAVVFVRSALGPNGRPGLEIVQIAETADSRGPALVRTRAPFVPLPTGDPQVDPIPFADPVVLLRPPLHLAFAYAGADGNWKRAWRPSGELPSAVRFDVHDSERGTLISTATRIHIEMRAPRPETAGEAAEENAQPQPGGATGGQ